MKVTVRATVVAAVLPLMASVGAADSADLMEAMQGAGSFETMTRAVEAASLDDVFRGDGPFTVFAPSDQALIAEGWDVLLDGVYRTPRNRARLFDLVGYHVVRGEAFDLSSLGERSDLITWTGETITLEPADDGIVINGHIEVLDTLVVNNGVIHVVSGLLWPDLYPAEGEELALAAAR